MKANEFGKYIKQLRNDKELTIRQLELYSGVSNSYLSQLENGKRGIPSPEILKKLAKGLKISYQELMEAAGYIEEHYDEKDFDSLKEINNLLKKYNIDQSGFFDIEKWKKAGPEGIKQLESYFQFIVQEAEKLEKEEKQE